MNNTDYVEIKRDDLSCLTRMMEKITKEVESTKQQAELVEGILVNVRALLTGLSRT